MEEESRKLSIYLAGKIAGLTFEQANGWRQRLIDRWGQEYRFINPMDREPPYVPKKPLSWKEWDEQTCTDVVEGCTNSIYASDIVVVYLPAEHLNTPMVGTCFELGYAYASYTPIIVISDTTELHPFVYVACQRIMSREEALTEVFKEAIEDIVEGFNI